eukprot:1160461-Pelagomonas_calceolata.AAC.4
MELFWGPEVAGLGKSKPKLLESLFPSFARCTPGHQNLAVLEFPKDFYCPSHCLPRPPDTAGLPSRFNWEDSRVGGSLGGLRQPGVNFTGRRQAQGLTLNEWGFARNE